MDSITKNEAWRERVIWVIGAAAISMSVLSMLMHDNKMPPMVDADDVVSHNPPTESHNKLIAATTKGMLTKRDEFERISFYAPAKSDVKNDRLYAYISMPDGGSANLHIRLSYSASSSIFFRQVKVLADGAVVYQKDFGPLDVKYNALWGSVLESIDYAATREDADALRVIANSSRATIRFSGRGRQADFDLSKRDLDNIKTAVQAYNALAQI